MCEVIIPKLIPGDFISKLTLGDEISKLTLGDEISWLIPDEEIPSSFPADTPLHVVEKQRAVENQLASQTSPHHLPLILIVGSGREQLRNTVVQNNHLYTRFVSRSAVELLPYIRHQNPAGAIIVNRRSGDSHEDNLAASILSSYKIPFIICSAPSPGTSTMLRDAPYFDIGHNGENIAAAVDYLTEISSMISSSVHKPSPLVRRRGISRARL